MSKKTYWVEFEGELGIYASSPMEAVEKALKGVRNNPEFCISRVYHTYQTRDNYSVEKVDMAGYEVREKLKEVKDEEAEVV